MLPLSAEGFRRTKIVCTLGPACADEKTLTRLVEAGLNVARLNFSHGTHESHAETLALLRRVAARAGRSVGVLQDLCGPKIRVGEMPGGAVDLTAGQAVWFLCDPSAAAAHPGGLPVDYEDLARDVKSGDRILFDDGALEARVQAVEAHAVQVVFARGGVLKTRKGMNLPGVKVSAPSVTAKDLADLEWGLAHQVDWVALSFVRQAADLAPVRARLSREADPPLLIPKIETPEAVGNIEAILRASDGLMIARGDLGVELDFEQVPVIQKRLIRLANELDIPVITATQMLESMTQSPRPTRAEASDVANAILDGTDAVMLSGETASGRYPVEAVEAMSRIALEAERLLRSQPRCLQAPQEAPATCLHDALAMGVERIAQDLEIKAIAVATIGGDTARYIASSRPRVPVLGLSPDPRAHGRMALFWGIQPVFCPPFLQPGDALRHAEAAVLASGLARAGEVFILAVGRGPSREFSARINIRQIGAGGDQVPGDQPGTEADRLERTVVMRK